MEKHDALVIEQTEKLINIVLEIRRIAPEV